LVNNHEGTKQKHDLFHRFWGLQGAPIPLGRTTNWVIAGLAQTIVLFQPSGQSLWWNWLRKRLCKSFLLSIPNFRSYRRMGNSCL
jgi:hypothetical protein